jgi:hypothetical protein
MGEIGENLRKTATATATWLEWSGTAIGCDISWGSVVGFKFRDPIQLVSTQVVYI